MISAKPFTTLSGARVHQAVRQSVRRAQPALDFAQHQQEPAGIMTAIGDKKLNR
jgi:hypothetical protein